MALCLGVHYADDTWAKVSRWAFCSWPRISAFIPIH